MPTTSPLSESLEPRRLMAYAFGSGGLLALQGTPTHDSIVISLRENGTLRVNLNGEILRFEAASINEIQVITLGGNDLIRFDDTIPIVKRTRVLAGSGNDTIEGSHGRDTISGNGGSDLLDGDFGTDSLYGDNGDDTLLGRNGNDGLHGGSGNDLLSGGIGIDRLFGGPGEDDLDGGTGVDQLIGGSSNDDFANNSSSGEVVDWGSDDSAPNSLLA